MSLDKSLYMYSFHKERDLLGTVEYTKVIDPLYDNLYSSFISTKETKVVQKVVEDIQDKIIDLSKEDKHILFPDVGDLDDVGDVEGLEESELPKELPKPEDIKTIVVKGEKPLEEKPNEEVKTVSIDPNYKVESDK